MPELPEVQAHAERLTERYRGAVLNGFTPMTFTALKTVQPAPADAIGTALDGVGRRGKYLLARFGSLTFVVHLMQGGRLREEQLVAAKATEKANAKKNATVKRPAKPKNGLARWTFDDGRSWLLTEAGTERRAGVWCSATDGLLERAPLVDLGPEALTVTTEQLANAFADHNVRLHSFLRNQGCIAGLGRRLANEVCHRAKLSPFAMTGKLGADGAEAIVAAIAAACQEGLDYERTRADMSASADRPGGVHHRTGEPCPTCGDTVREVKYSSYTVNYCPTCQTAGKVLADNTTSRFLK